MPDRTRESAFHEAARLLGVPVAVFRLWMIMRKPVSQQRWSQWEGGHKPIPDGVIREFLAEFNKPNKSDQEFIDDVKGFVEAELFQKLPRMRPELKPRFADHLKKQVALLLDAGDGGVAELQPQTRAPTAPTPKTEPGPPAGRQQASRAAGKGRAR